MRFSFLDFLLALLTVGYHYRNERKLHLQECERWRTRYEYAVWPFLTREDYMRQLEVPPFLNGGHAVPTLL